jgi:FixJ family two-component response regulator
VSLVEYGYRSGAGDPGDAGNLGVERRRRTDVTEADLISIVDDDESVREALESLIRSVGLRAEAFASAEDFLSSRHVEDTGCLILDVRMSGVGGFELHRRLRDSGRRIPTIFITAHADDETRARALEDGAVDFLPKPFTEQAVLRAIGSALDSDTGSAPSPP